MKKDNRDWVQSLSDDIAEFYGRLARALPKLKCDPSHSPRERDDACKSCVEAREEMQQLIAEGDAGVVSIGVNVYLRRLYVVHDQIAAGVANLRRQIRVYKGIAEFDALEVWADELEKETGELEMIFAEVLTEEDRDIPTDEEFLGMVRDHIGVDSNAAAAQVLAETLEKMSKVSGRNDLIEKQIKDAAEMLEEYSGRRDVFQAIGALGCVCERLIQVVQNQQAQIVDLQKGASDDRNN